MWDDIKQGLLQILLSLFIVIFRFFKNILQWLLGPKRNLDAELH